MQLPFIHRSIWSYARVMHVWGKVIRNRRWQLKQARVRSLKYLDAGCGPNTHPEFINLDYRWSRQIDLCWDIAQGLPFSDASLRGIFSEHCLEHFPLPLAMKILQECRRVLEPGGAIRLVVPDGGLYLQIYAEQQGGHNTQRFPFQERQLFGSIGSPILSVNRVFYQDRESLFGHRTMFDADLLGKLLEAAGFSEIREMGFQKSRDVTLAIDTPSRACESLYMEASVG